MTAIATLLTGGYPVSRNRGTQGGSVRLRGTQWYIAFREPSIDAAGNIAYKKVERAIEGATSRRDAERKGYDQHVAGANALTKVPQGVATLKEFVELRFTPDHIDYLKTSGQSHYKTMLAHILPALGGMRLTDVTPQVVQVLLNAKNKSGLSPQTVLHIRNAVSAIFHHAKGLGFYAADAPTEYVRVPTMVRKERQALSWPQVELLAGAIDPRYRALVIALATTGLRIGEATGLCWRHVNLSDDWRVVDGVALPPNALMVSSNWVRGERTTTKSRAGRRTIPLTSESWVALAGRYELATRRGDDDPVFASRTGTPLDQHNVARRHLKPAARAVGLPWASWHCLRHTTATMADQVLTVAEKMKLLGHSSPAMSTHYTHPDLDRIRRAMEEGQTKGRPN